MRIRQMLNAQVKSLLHTADVSKLSPTLAAWGGAILGPLINFVSVQAYVTLLALVIIDWLTGAYKARELNRLGSNKLSIAGKRVFEYVMIFAAMHLVSKGTPELLKGMTLGSLAESFMVTCFMMRELLSILENVATVWKARGKENKFLTALIKVLGANEERLLKEIENRGPKS